MAVAVVVLLGGGVGYRALASYLARAPEQFLFAPGTLTALPLVMGDWAGTDEALDAALVRAADVDDYINRVYVRKTDNQAVGLWVAFGVRARDLVPHRPEVCYPGAGWTLRGQETALLHLEDGAPLRARLLTFAPGGLDPRHQIVLNYYIVDGQTCEDVSLLRSKAWRGQASIRYVAQIQITCRMNPARPAAFHAEAVRGFATESFGLIRSLLEGAVGLADSGGAPGKS